MRGEKCEEEEGEGGGGGGGRKEEREPQSGGLEGGRIRRCSTVRLFNWMSVE